MQNNSAAERIFSGFAASEIRQQIRRSAAAEGSRTAANGESRNDSVTGLK